MLLIVTFFPLYYTEIQIMGQYRDLTVGSNTVLTCTAQLLSDSSFRWLSADGNVVNNSAVLSLHAVDSTINDRVFKCAVSSPNLFESVEKSISINIKGTIELYIYIAKYLNVTTFELYSEPDFPS